MALRTLVSLALGVQLQAVHQARGYKKLSQNWSWSVPPLFRLGQRPAVYLGKWALRRAPCTPRYGCQFGSSRPR